MAHAFLHRQVVAKYPKQRNVVNSNLLNVVYIFVS